jgi:imidazolonepropionase-like amidohydrolase
MLALLLPMTVLAGGLADDPHLTGEAGEGAAAEDPGDSEGDDSWDVLAEHGQTHSLDLTLTEATWMDVTVHGERYVTSILGDLFVGSLAGGPLEPLTTGPQWDTEPQLSPDGRRVAYASDEGGNENVWIIDLESGDKRQVTKEKEARVTAPAWDDSGEWLVVRRRTVDTRSIGVTELWQVHHSGGSGTALTTKDSNPHAGEADIVGDHVYFSNRRGRFEYGHNPTGGLWNIARLDRDSGAIDSIVQGSGSAVRPVVSPSGEELAFVTRDRTKTKLELVELSSGRRRVLADWLDHDQMEGFALHGVYPGFDWTDDGESIVLWAQGKLWRIGMDGGRTELPFEAKGSWRMHQVERSPQTVPDEVEARVIRWAVENPRDGRLAFSALGELWTQAPGQAPARVSTSTGYAPAWSPDGKRLAWVSWTDCPLDEPPVGADYVDCGGALHITKGKRTETLPLRGQWVAPAWLPDGEGLLAWRGTGGTTMAPLTGEPRMELVKITTGKRGNWATEVLSTEGFRGGLEHAPVPVVHGERVYFLSSRPGQGRVPAVVLLRSVSIHGGDARDHARFDGAQEVALSPDLRHVAWRQDYEVHVAPFRATGGEQDFGGGAVPKRTVSDIDGAWLSWSPDGDRLHWMQANERHTLTVDDAVLFDPDRDENDDVAGIQTETVSLRMPRARPSGTVAYTHATVLTMESSDGAPCADCTVVVEGDRIASVTPGGAVPAGAREVDLAGATVIPGLIDVHAHLHYTAGDVLPAQEWRYLVNLDYGVTTVHDPSANTELVFTQKERVLAGLELGPRIYSTGFVLYGALGHYNAETPDADTARRHVQRLKNLGATSVKVYQQSRRDQRQWYIEACDELGMICTAEGGGDIWMNLGMVADGMHAIEHALPRAPLYADVQAFFAGSSQAENSWGSAYTQTLNVAYGGLPGQHWYWQHMHPFADGSREQERMLRHYPRRLLDRKAWRRSFFIQDGDWNHEQVARDAAAMMRKGLLTTLGAHGELQGLGVHWELWSMGGPGAMTPTEALFSATMHGARYLGLEAELGSISAGKLADFVVLNADPREDIHHSSDIRFVVANGRVWGEQATAAPRER